MYSFEEVLDIICKSPIWVQQHEEIILSIIFFFNLIFYEGNSLLLSQIEIKLWILYATTSKTSLCNTRNSYLNYKLICL